MLGIKLRMFSLVHGNFSAWANWTECTVECGNGTQVRGRECNNPAPAYGGEPCQGDAIQMDFCNEHHCPSKKFISLLLV
jgi:hypothetical protein